MVAVKELWIPPLGPWVSLKLAPPWSCITPVAISWSEDTYPALLLASAMSARSLLAGSETERRTAGSAPSHSCQTDPPPLSRRGSKSSELTRGATSTLLEESPSSKACPPCSSRDRGCALLWWRGSDNLPIAGDSLPVCTEHWSERWFMYEITDVLSVRISTCCSSSCGRKSYRAKKTSSSSKRFMCHWLWGSDPSHEALEHCSPDSSRWIRRDHDT